MRWKHTRSHDGGRQGLCVFRHLKGRQAGNDCEPLLHLRGIADGGFVDDDLGHRAVKLASPICPPILGGLLVPRDNHIATRTSDQVADERSFQVHRFHADPWVRCGVAFAVHELCGVPQ